jgi:hypothetical protein
MMTVDPVVSRSDHGAFPMATVGETTTMNNNHNEEEGGEITRRLSFGEMSHQLNEMQQIDPNEVIKALKDPTAANFSRFVSWCFYPLWRSFFVWMVSLCTYIYSNLTCVYTVADMLGVCAVP